MYFYEMMEKQAGIKRFIRDVFLISKEGPTIEATSNNAKKMVRGAIKAKIKELYLGRKQKPRRHGRAGK